MLLYTIKGSSGMERKYKFNRDEIRIIDKLNKMNVPTGDVPSFQKFLLELERNVILGGKSSVTLYGLL